MQYLEGHDIALSCQLMTARLCVRLGHKALKKIEGLAEVFLGLSRMAIIERAVA